MQQWRVNQDPDQQDPDQTTTRVEVLGLQPGATWKQVDEAYEEMSDQQRLDSVRNARRDFERHVVHGHPLTPLPLPKSPDESLEGPVFIRDLPRGGKCRDCSAMLEEADQFCSACGTTVATQRDQCPKCEHSLIHEAAYCYHCGHHLTAEDPAPAQQRSTQATTAPSPRPVTEARTATPKTSRSATPKAKRSVTEASPGQRFGAWLLDGVYGLIVLVGVAGVVAANVGVNDLRDDLAANAGGVITILVGAWLILSAFEVMGGAHGAGSLGKRSLGLRIQAWPQHERRHPAQNRGDRLCARFILKHIILAIPIVNLICLIFMATREDHRAWYDQMAGTVVVKI